MPGFRRKNRKNYKANERGMKLHCINLIVLLFHLPLMNKFKHMSL